MIFCDLITVRHLPKFRVYAASFKCSHASTKATVDFCMLLMSRGWLEMVSVIPKPPRDPCPADRRESGLLHSLIEVSMLIRALLDIVFPPNRISAKAPLAVVTNTGRMALVTAGDACPVIFWVSICWIGMGSPLD